MPEQTQMPEAMKLFCDENQNSVISCDWYMHKACPETCAYAKQILGVGASDTGTARRIRENLDKLMKEDLGDY